MTGKRNWTPNAGECEETLRYFVKEDTCQPEGKEEKLVDWIIRTLPANAEYKKLAYSRGRASLIVKLPGKEDAGGTAFLGHLDTVACSDAAEWSVPTHGAVVRGGRMYGRGTADMKGGDTAMFLVMHQLFREHPILRRSVYFCFTADEERNGAGAIALAESGLIDKIGKMIVCEPSDERISICEKGAYWLNVQAKGIAAHGSRPELGVNAIEAAILFWQRIRLLLDGQKENPVLGKPTVSVTKLTGGVMTNIIPCEAEMELDIRTIPGMSHAELLRQAKEISRDMTQKIPGLQLTLEVLNDRPALETEKSCTFVKQICEIAAEIGLRTQTRGHYFYTDASQIIPKLQIPFVIAGPGDDAQAHCRDESIEIASIERFAKLYYRYLMKWESEEER